MRKLLLITFVIIVIVSLVGCATPKDEPAVFLDPPS